MDCLKPVTKVNRSFPCGRCPLCIRSRRRVWTHRLILETMSHDQSCFVTLTYKDMPEGNSLQPLDVQNWMKELRHAIEPSKVRFFLSGEYGAAPGFRPHYHVLLFGLNALVAGGFDGNGGVVAETWRKGFSSVRDVNPARCAYVAGYVDKKMVGRQVPLDPRDRRKYADGRVAEFIRMSMRPGIGRYAADVISGAFAKSPAWVSYVQSTGDVPTSLRHGRVLLPLGRYLRGKIRDVIRSCDGTESEEFRETLAGARVFERLQGLRAEDEVAAKAAQKSVQKIVLDRVRQKAYNILARESLKRKGQI